MGYMGMGGAQIHIHLPLCHIVMEYNIPTCRGKQVCKEVEIKAIMYHATWEVVGGPHKGGTTTFTYIFFVISYWDI